LQTDSKCQQEAIYCFRQAIKIKADFAEAYGKIAIFIYSNSKNEKILIYGTGRTIIATIIPNMQ
jgi:hypothetical protein